MSQDVVPPPKGPISMKFESKTIPQSKMIEPERRIFKMKGTDFGNCMADLFGVKGVGQCTMKVNLDPNTNDATFTFVLPVQPEEAPPAPAPATPDPKTPAPAAAAAVVA